MFSYDGDGDEKMRKLNFDPCVKPRGRVNTELAVVNCHN